MIRESLADSNQIQWQVLAKSLQLQLTDSRLWQVLYIYSMDDINIDEKLSNYHRSTLTWNCNNQEKFARSILEIEPYLMGNLSLKFW